MKSSSLRKWNLTKPALLFVSLLIVYCVLPLASSAAPAQVLSDTLNITTPAHINFITLSLHRAGDYFEAQSVRIPAATVDNVFRIASESRLDVPNFLASSGVTDDALSSHRGELLRHYCGAEPTPESLPDAIQALFTYNTLKAYFSTPPNIAQHGPYAAPTRFDFLLSQIKALSFAPRQIFGRNLIQVEGSQNTWFTDNPELFKALDELGRPAYPNFQTLVDSPKPFSTDLTFWAEYLHPVLYGVYWPGIYRGLDGFSAANQFFRIDRVLTGLINSYPFSLYMQLSTREPALIDRVWWFNPIVPDWHLATWHQLRQTHQRCTRILRRHQWLIQWKAETPDHHVELEVYGHEGFWSGDSGYKQADAAWQHAGLKGHPTYKLRFRVKDQWVGDWAVSDDDPRAVILSSPRTFEEGIDGQSWFDQLSVSVYKSTYAVVEPTGQYSIRTHQFFSPLTPARP